MSDIAKFLDECYMFCGLCILASERIIGGKSENGENNGQNFEHKSLIYTCIK